MPKPRTEEFYIPDSGEIPNGFPKWAADMCQLFAGEKTEITFERPTRSLDQNAYYHGVVLPAVHEGLREAGVTEMHLWGSDGEAIELPITVNFLHLYFKNKYLEPEEPGKDPTTTTLSMTGMHTYIENIRYDEWVQRHEIHVPQPNQPPPEAYET